MSDDTPLFDAPVQVWSPLATVTAKPARGAPRRLLDVERSDRGGLRVRAWARGKPSEWSDTSEAWLPLFVRARCSAVTDDGTIGCQLASGQTVPGCGTAGAAKMIQNAVKAARRR